MNTLADAFPITVARALERMAFVIVQPGIAPVDRILPQCRACARIEFHGGWLCVALTSAMVAEIAGGLLGLDEPAVAIAEHGPSTAQELVNVLGGEIVMALGGGERPIRLGMPQDVSATEAALYFGLTDAGTSTCVLQSEAGFLLVAFAVT